jgi:hypothetical protein
MLEADNEPNVLAPVTESVPLSVMLEADTPASVLVPVTDKAPLSERLEAETPAKVLVPLTDSVPLSERLLTLSVPLGVLMVGDEPLMVRVPPPTVRLPLSVMVLVTTR